MDSRSRKLLSAIDAYMENPPHGIPDQLASNISDMREMLNAPLYSGESPGEKSAREVAEANMPSQVYNEYYGSDEGETSDDNVGVFGQSEGSTLR